MLTAGAGVALYATVAVLALRGGPTLLYWLALLGGAVVLAAGTVLAPRSPRGLLIVLVGAALFRVALVPTAPVLSDDLYRYLWDGRVQAAGVNPYRYPPNAPELSDLRDDEVWARVNRQGSPTIYPPWAQAVFAAAHRAGLRSATAWKALVVAADLLGTVLLARVLAALGREPRRVVAYAWNPLPILAFAHSGHLEGFVVVLLAGACLAWLRGAVTGTGLLLGLAGGLKLYPLALVPAFVRGRTGHWSTRGAVTLAGAALAVVAAGYLPLLTLGSGALGYLSGGYLRAEGYLSGERFLLFTVLGLEGRVLAPVVLAAVVAAALRSRRPAPTRAAWVLGALIALTTSYPWYAAPLVALAVAGSAGTLWPWLGVALEAAYLSMAARLTVFPLTRPLRIGGAALVAVLVFAAVGSLRARRAVVGEST